MVMNNVMIFVLILPEPQQRPNGPEQRYLEPSVGPTPGLSGDQRHPPGITAEKTTNMDRTTNRERAMAVPKPTQASPQGTGPNTARLGQQQGEFKHITSVLFYFIY